MRVRGPVFVRGLGVLIIALAAVTAATLASEHRAASSPGAVSPPVAVSATPTAGGVTATPVTTPASTQYVARIAGPASFLDKTTSTSAAVDEVRVDSTVSGVLPAPRQFDLLFRITLHNGAGAPAHYSAANFYLLAGSGDTYGAAAIMSHRPALSSGTLDPGGTASGWIGFTLPAAPATLTLLWNDDNRLLVPATFAQTLVRRDSH